MRWSRVGTSSRQTRCVRRILTRDFPAGNCDQIVRNRSREKRPAQLGFSYCFLYDLDRRAPFRHTVGSVVGIAKSLARPLFLDSSVREFHPIATLWFRIPTLLRHATLVVSTPPLFLHHALGWRRSSAPRNQRWRTGVARHDNYVRAKNNHGRRPRHCV